MSALGRKAQPWSTADATDAIREIARGDFTLDLSQHASEQMRTRELMAGDVLHVMKNGFVHRDAQRSTQEGLYKYAIEGRTPNSGNRSVRLIVVPCARTREIKVVTVMWVDEGTVKG